MELAVASADDGPLAAPPVNDAAVCKMNDQHMLACTIVYFTHETHVADAQLPVALQDTGIGYKPHPGVIETRKFRQRRANPFLLRPAKACEIFDRAGMPLNSQCPALTRRLRWQSARKARRRAA